ncbi:capsular biosynthesis protein [Staphylococcus agnetis]|uniref:type 8 capsular polysaccharide synthesis protein Cap8I n=1 Tax=Staphylococcus agnetis TaxID=985762 RepID=UPI000D1C1ED0|nr:type 8 capsular polysaccharide synthesis protein Cap8I [Staphylococcus agnetis]PTH13724.1 capsular biosynthesis protein [Staphylococcus agnetis]
MKTSNLLLLITSLISFIIILINGEIILSLMPLFFVFSWLITRFIKNGNLFFTKGIFILFGFIRLVLIPLVIAISGDKKIDNLPLGFMYFNQGVLLIIFEYLVGAILLVVLSKIFKDTIKSRKEFKLAGSRFFYYIFIIFVIIAFVSIPSVRETVSFLIIKTDASGRGEEATAGINVLLRLFLQLSLMLLFIISSYRSYQKYKVNPSFIYLILPLIFGIINVGLIVGERRSIQIYTLVGVLVIISLLFKYHSQKVNIVILSVGAFILISMTLYKELYVFNFSSYTDALNSSNVNNVKFIDSLQSYFYGPHNVAASIAYLNYYDGSLRQLIFDYTRSIFGINMLVDKSQLLTSQLFNQIIYGNKQLTGHLISSAGYGYIYFGPLLFPIVLFTNLLMASTLEYLIRKNNCLDLIFIGTYLFMRVSFTMFGHTIPILTTGTMVLIVFSAIILISIFVKKILRLVMIDYDKTIYEK